MTEDEAKQKWCPFARVMSAHDEGNWNRGKPDEVYHRDPKCIASSCMAWRWDIDPVDAAIGEVKAMGYCGLAGKP